MTELQTLQAYWWLLIAVIGALLVFLLFVQGGQSMLFCGATPEGRKLMVNSLGRKWELTFTTLVLFGGAFFASFPLFYSTSFGGAYWLWMLILLSFVLQAVSYEYRSKPGNIYGSGTFDAFLLFNGIAGCVLLGVAVGTLFFGAEFTVTKTNLLNPGAPVISSWAPTHGLEAIANWRCILLGVMLFFLARTQGALYFINNINDHKDFGISLRNRVLISGTVFAILFVGFMVVLMRVPGLRFVGGRFVEEQNIYLHNAFDMWPLSAMIVVGALMVLFGIYRSAFSSRYRYGIWWTGIGSVLVVIALLLLAGYADTAYMRSTIDPASSLTIANSSSSLFTLKTMAYVSIGVPFVLAYIVYVWYKMNRRPLTAAEVNADSHSY
ncbi:MAG: cytochrome d ubiquinol oxidase subunit II [Muribaculaceae bacterium]|nr:cytochrome d ubiquinol oxidase subunit II [Muribaculaceae bacterium]